MKVAALALIPARYQSSRFPGKPLAPILNKSMIQRVYENCSSEQLVTYVVTDDDRIENHVKEFGGQCVRVDDAVETGTERIWLAYQRFFKKQNYQFVLNVQGDEPLIAATEIQKLMEFHSKCDFDIATMVRRRSLKDADFTNPNVVKAIFSEEYSSCLYFSRSSIPTKRDNIDSSGNKSFDWFQHIGIYSYTVEAIEKFAKCQRSYYEKIEMLEQLRALENGLKIGAVETNSKFIGVDSKEDVVLVENYLRSQE